MPFATTLLPRRFAHSVPLLVNAEEGDCSAPERGTTKDSFIPRRKDGNDTSQARDAGHEWALGAPVVPQHYIGVDKVGVGSRTNPECK